MLGVRSWGGCFVVVLFFFPITLNATGICGDAMAQLQSNTGLAAQFLGDAPYLQVYDQVLQQFGPHRELRNLHAGAMPKGNVRIIDAGGGTGLLTRQLMAEDLNRRIEIFDRSPEMTQIAARNQVDAATIHLSSITDLKRKNGERVPDKSIDGIMTNNVLYVLSRGLVAQFLREAHRVLRPGGRLSIASMRTVEPSVMRAFLTSMREEILSMERRGLVPKGAADTFVQVNRTLTNDNPTTFTLSEIEALARFYGFRPIAPGTEAYGGAAFFIAFEKL